MVWYEVEWLLILIDRDYLDHLMLGCMMIIKNEAFLFPSILINLILIFCINGMVLERHMLIKFFICYELFIFNLSSIILISSVDINSLLIILFLLWSSTFEAVLALSVSYRFNHWKYLLQRVYLMFGSLLVIKSIDSIFSV